MTDPRSVVRAVLVYALCIPAAIMLGYMLAMPLDFASLVSIGLVLTLLLAPVFLRWHYPLLLLSWNTIAVLPFLPGRPQIRLLLTGISLLITWLMYTLDRRSRPQNVGAITWPLLAMLAAIFLTMQVTGGAGFLKLGGTVGGAGRYVLLAGAILGYFAISARPIPVEKANLYVALFFLGGLTQMLSSLAAFVPDWLKFIFYVFPMEESFFEQSPTVVGFGVSRIYGGATASMCALLYLLARFGLRGIFDTTKAWRAVAFIVCCIGVLIGGYRSFMLLVLGIVGVQAYLEGFFRMKYLPVWLVIAGLGLSLWPMANRLPYRIQRSLAFLPWLPVSNEVYLDTQGSTEWRTEIWARVWREWRNEPSLWLLGKGYRLDVRDMENAIFRGGHSGALTEVASDYHSGPLTVIVPLGLVGAVVLIWFWIASWRLLLRNYHQSPPELKMINTLLLAMFCVRVFHFLIIFGNFYSDLANFTALVGLSVAINGAAVRVESTSAEAEVSSPTPPRRLRFPVSPPASVKS